MISYNTSQSKAELYTLAEENGIEVNEDMTKTTIINAITNYNNSLEETPDLSESDTEEEPKEEPLEETPDLSESDTEEEPKEEPLEETLDLSESDTEEESNHYRTYVYVGPTLPNGALKEKTVFRGSRNDVLEALADVLEDYPRIEKMIVPFDQLAVMSARAKTKGNTTHNDYSNIASTVAGKRRQQQMGGLKE